MTKFHRKHAPSLTHAPGVAYRRIPSHGAAVCVALLAMTLAGATVALAAGTFYVDPSNPQASDSGPGTAAQPYRTISAAVTTRGGPGTTILVAPGTYREQITVGASGSSTSPFVLSAAGPGAVIDGADDFAKTASWSLVSGNVWRAASVSWSPKQVFAGTTRLTASSASTASLPANTFRYVSGQGLYVNVGGGNPGAQPIAIGRRPYGVKLSGRSWVTLDGFTVTHADDRGIYLSSSSNQCTVSGNTISFSYSYGVQLSAATGGRITGNVVSDHLNHGIYLSSSTTGVLVDGNECFRNSRAGGSAANGIVCSGSSSNRIERNRLHDNSGAGVQITSSSNNCVLVQNRSWRNGLHGFQVSGSTGVHHVGDVAWGNTRRGFSFEGTSTGACVNNVIAADNGITANEYDVYVELGAFSGFISNDNVIWNSTAQAPVRWGSTAYATLAAFLAATGNDSRSTQASPRFVSAATGDFHVGAGSSAIDAANASVADWPPLDAEGRARADDPSTQDRGLGSVSFADRGALEFAPSATGPTARVSVTPPAGAAPLDVLADASRSTSPTSTIDSYRFDFGDGVVVGPGVGSMASHTFAAGTWTLTLTVVDGLGAVATTTTSITVTAVNVRPQASLSYSLGPNEGFRDLIVDPSLVFTSPVVSQPAYLAPGAEPTFATTLTRIAGNSGTAITGLAAPGSWGSDARHHYSKDEPWNSDGTLIAIENSGSPGDLLLDGETYVPVSGPCPNYDQGDDRWHPQLPRVRVNAKNSELSWFDVVDCVKLRSWPLPFAVDYFGPSEGNTSRDGRFAALTDGRRAFVVDMDPQPPFAPYPAQRIGPVYDFSSCGLSTCALGWVSISPSGKYVVVKYVNDHPRVLDVNPQTLELTPRPMPDASPRCAGTAAQGFIYDLGHADMTLNPFDNDEDVLIGQEHCGWRGTTVSGQSIGAVVMVRLRDGAVTALTDPTNEASAHHISCRNTLRPGWAYVGYKSEPGARFSDEIVAVKLDGSKQVQRLAHKHSYVGPYRAESHAVPSPDGRRVMFASNWAINCVSCPGTSDIKGYIADARATSSTEPGVFRQSVVFDASASRDADGRIASYRFDFGDGSPVWQQSWPVTSHTFATGVWNVKLVVSDNLSSADSTVVAVTVRPPNWPPNGSIDAPALDLTLVRGDSVAFSASGVDPNGDTPLTFAWNFGGSATNRTGANLGFVRFDVTGSYVVTLTATDPLGLADPTPDTVRVEVHLDRPPVAEAPTWALVSTGAQAVVNVFASDPDHDPIVTLAADLDGLPATRDATFTPATGNTSGQLRWRPQPVDARPQPYRVVFTAANALFGSDTTEITVTRPPVVAAPDTVRGDEGTRIAFDIVASDPDGDTLDSLRADTSALPGNSGARLVAMAGNDHGTFTWTPSFADAKATPYRIVFTAGNAFTGSDTTWIIVSPVDRPPLVVAPAAITVAAESLLALAVSSTDPDGDPIGSMTVDRSELPAGADVEFTEANGTGTLTWRPTAADARGEPYAVRFSAWNAASGAASTRITVSRAPIVTAPDVIEVDEGALASFDVSAGDPDGDPIDSLVANVTALPAGAGAKLVVASGNRTGVFSWRPTFSDGRSAPYPLIFQAANALSGVDTTWVRVRAVDRAPVVSAPTHVSGEVGVPLVIDVRVTDPDGDAIDVLRTNVSGLPANAETQFVAAGANHSGRFTWTPRAEDFAGAPYAVRFIAENALLDSAEISIALSRGPVVVAADTARVDEGATLTFTVTASDPDLEPIASFTCDRSGLPSGNSVGFVVQNGNGSATFTWTPTYSDGRAAPYRVIYEAANALVGRDTTWIVVTPVDRAPVLSSPASASATEGQPLTVQVTAADADGDSLVITANLSGFPVGVTFAPGTATIPGILSWTPGPNDGRSAPYSVTFTASNALSVSATAAITVADVPAGGGSNLVANPGFETDLSGWIKLGTAILTKFTGGHSGTSCVEISTTSTGTFGITDNPNLITGVASAGISYHFTAWVRSTAHHGAGKIKVREFAGGTQQGSSAYSVPVTLSPAWQQITFDYVTRTAGSYLDIEINDYPVASSEIFQIDDVSITRTSPVPAALAQSDRGVPAPGAVFGAQFTSNPIRGEGELRFTTTLPGPVRLQIYDVGGRLVSTPLDQAFVLAGQHRVVLRVTGAQPIPSGVYFFRLRAAEGVKRGRFIVAE